MEFCVVINSNAAPFVSDQSFLFRAASTADEALDSALTDYSHPCGAYSAAVYASADGYHKHEPPLARWLSERAGGLAERMTTQNF
jgi:hypothetical protein